MDHQERGNAVMVCDANVIRAGGVAECGRAEGHYVVECFDKDGNFKWRDEIFNTVATLGKNLVLDQALAGSSYTVVGPYMGLISSVSYSTIVAADTMASHAGWTEAGGTNAPTYSGTRKTVAMSAASGGSKALSSALNFTFTGAGTIKGCFVCIGTGAVSTLDSTAGTLLSAGLFSGGDKIVANADQINVSWSFAI